MLGGDRRRLELAYSAMFTLPGTPCIRYGDEIGMGDLLALPERNAARTPMQWSGDANGGFSRARHTVLPVIAKGPFAFRDVNVADQRRDAGSMLNWMERLIRMRKECPEIGWGDFDPLDTGAREVLALRYEWRGNAIVVVHNFGAKAREITLPAQPGRLPLTNLLTHDHAEPDARGRYRVELEPYGYRWYRIGGMTDVATRTAPGKLRAR